MSDQEITKFNLPKYLFYIETRDALTDQQEYIEWRGLTYKQARDMYAYTDSHQPSNVTGYGWEEIKPAIQENVK